MAIMSDIPTVFINYKYIAPLKKMPMTHLQSGFFYLIIITKFFFDIVSFLNKDIDEINKIWENKKLYRDRLKENFISSSQKYDLNKIFK